MHVKNSSLFPINGDMNHKATWHSMSTCAKQYMSKPNRQIPAFEPLIVYLFDYCDYM